MKAGLGNIMKQAQKMQEDMKQLQEELATMEIAGSAGGGMVNVTLNGRHELLRVNIDNSLWEDDKEMVEDLVAAAVNDAVHKLEKMSQERMAEATSGLGLPPGMKLPF